jgi:kynureninase
MNAPLDVITTLDAEDPLAHFRDKFALKEGLIYLDGNSLGALPKATIAKMEHTVQSEWGEGLITSWTEADWVNAPSRIGDKIAKLIGAETGEVIAADSTSVNIFKALTAGLSLQSDRSVLLTELSNFPTDSYMMQGIARFSSGAITHLAIDPDDVLEKLDENVAVVLLTQVHYKTGRMRDMAEVTARAHEVGALVVWDLSHSTGAIEVDLNAAKADFAVGCGYKYLNGGPGAPAYMFAAKRHHNAQPVLSGWFGHARPFAFEESYDAAPGIDRFQCGTPSIIAMTALESGVELMLQADMTTIRRKSVALSELFIERMESLCDEFGFELVSPATSAERGSQVSYAHPNSYELVQALKARGVIGDFRAPDVMRFGFTPLYLRYADIVAAVEHLHAVCTNAEWDRPEYRERSAVT